MGSELLRILVLANAMLLALPPGTCSFLLAASNAEQKEAACPCSPPPKHDSPPPSEVPPSSCCCRFDSAPPPQLETIIVDMQLVVAMLPSSVSPSSQQGIVVDFAIHDTSPPLQILHCTWLC